MLPYIIYTGCHIQLDFRWRCSAVLRIIEFFVTNCQPITENLKKTMKTILNVTHSVVKITIYFMGAALFILLSLHIITSYYFRFNIKYFYIHDARCPSPLQAFIYGLAMFDVAMLLLLMCGCSVVDTVLREHGTGFFLWWWWWWGCRCVSLLESSRAACVATEIGASRPSVGGGGAGKPVLIQRSQEVGPRGPALLAARGGGHKDSPDGSVHSSVSSEGSP